MFKRFICWFKGHEWGFSFFKSPEGDIVRYEKCSRCPKFKDGSKKRLDNWLLGDHIVFNISD